MNDLTNPTASRPPSLTDLAISTPLWSLLSSGINAETEIAEIVASPELHAEAKRVCTALAMRASAAGESSVRLALQPLVLVYGVGEAARSPAFWQPYRILAGLPVEALRLGVDDYTAQPDSHFFPKPGPLKALCDKHAEPIYRAAFRASKAAALEAPKHRREPTDEERAQVRSMLAEYTNRITEKAPEKLKPALPNTAGKPAEGSHLTPEMLAALGRAGE